MSALLALLGTKDAIYAGIIAALLAGFGWYTIHERDIGKAAELAAFQRASNKAKTEAAATIAAQTADYATKLKNVQDAYSVQIQTAQSLAADLSNRLRQYQAASCPRGVLQGSAPTGASGTASAGGTGAVERALADLISAAAHDNVVIAAERAERDAITGK